MLIWSVLFFVFVALLVAAVVFSSLFPGRLPLHRPRAFGSRHRFRQLRAVTQS